MALWPLTGEIVVTFILSAGLLYRYGNWTMHNVVTTVSVFVAWFFSFIVIFILPLDISTTSYLQCRSNWNASHFNTTNNTTSPLSLFMDSNETVSTTTTTSTTTQVPVTPVPMTPAVEDVCQEPWSYVPGNVLQSLWRIVYWTGQVLTWLVLPVMQSYSMAGDFTPLRKLRSALLENLIFYGVLAVTFVMLLIYVALHHSISLEYLKVICITASNTWGLFLLIVLLGYGLVEIPKSCYDKSRHNRRLNYMYFKVAKLSAEKCESEEQLDDALEQIQQTFEAVVGTHRHLRPYMDVVLDKCPHEWKFKLLQRYENDMEAGRGGRTVAYTENDLARLHRNILKASQFHHRTHIQWNLLIEKVISWEDVAKNQMNISHRYTKSFPATSSKTGLWRTVCDSFYTPTVEWYWKCKIRSPAFKVLGIVLALLSFVVIWSEMTFSVTSPRLSVFALLYDVCRRSENYFLTEFFSIISIAYLCVCAYYTVFKIRVFNYYYLASHHQTDEYSLIFCGILLCRLTPPLCLNFLSLMHLDSHVIKMGIDRNETAFTSIMGHMDVIPIVSRGFNVYLPIVMCIFCVATFLDVGTRFLHFMGIEQFIMEDELTTDLIRDGQELVKREKAKKGKLSDNRSRSGRIIIPGADGQTVGERLSSQSRAPISDPVATRSGDTGESSRLELLNEAVDYHSTGQITDQALRPKPAVPLTNIFDDV